jgi:hypothetical protein
MKLELRKGYREIKEPDVTESLNLANKIFSRGSTAVPGSVANPRLF